MAANTTMCHLLAGLAPDSLGAAPFTPCPGSGRNTTPGNWSCPLTGRCTSPRRCPGYVGGDITADLLWAQMDRAERPTLLIDVGTNGEMALGGADRLLCCSTAAGSRL